MRLLQKLDLFSDIDPGRLKILAFASERCHYAPGEVLVHEGDESDGALILMSGTVEVQKSCFGITKKMTGSDSGVAIIGQSSMLSGKKCGATVTAETEVEVMRINRECFVKLMASCPKCSVGIMHSLGRQLDEDRAERADTHH
ncbi:cyclic nucleotide-binding domain-containing protein [Frigidibacter sp. MR17.24]|uniref:cyclic nucleotide-binding domain-containing protein n=1 Tax=Frigidibacter sp. MR17.24 TaxID=3127345 RepID=UPI003012C879